MRLDLTLLALVAPLAVLGDLRHTQRRTHSHHEIAKRAEGHVQLHKRFSNSRWTFYDVGGAAGACGQFNTPDQHIVALNSAQYGGGYPGPNCWKTIVMQIGDKQTTATITDECPGCPYGGLDLTRGLFQFFDSLDVGVLNGNWWFADDPNGGGGGGSPPPTKATTTSKPKPTTTWKPDPPQTTTHYTPTTTSTTEETTSTTHSSTHSSTHLSSASSSAASSSASHSGVAVVPAGVTSTENNNVQNILACNKVLVSMGGLVVAGEQA